MKEDELQKKEKEKKKERERMNYSYLDNLDGSWSRVFYLNNT